MQINYTKLFLSVLFGALSLMFLSIGFYFSLKIFINFGIIIVLISAISLNFI